jgi:DNA polymerase-1
MKLGGKVLVDGDIIAYRAAFATQDLRPKDATVKVEELLTFILNTTVLFPVSPSDYQVYLTGSGNFRNEIAKSHVYKGNRKSADKPIHLGYVRDYLIDKWGAIVSKGEEADDLIAIEATRCGPTTIVASIDKDMLQIPCYHFNFGRGEWYEVDEFGGLKFFYGQILTGDAADNIVGLHRVGQKTAEKILKDCSTEEEMWNAVVDAYEGAVDRVIENARLLWLRRQEGELWVPPDQRKQKVD